MKASPMIRSFNAGEFSELLDGRVDLDRYPASVHRLLNYISAPQGPAIGRSGTVFMAPNADETEPATLVPFVFSTEQAMTLEFGSDRIRFHDEDGLLVYTPVAATLTSAMGDPIEFDAPGLAANVGDQVVLSGFPNDYNLNGEAVYITAKSTDHYTLAKNFPALAVVNGTAARVYHVPCVYTEAQRDTLRFIQSIDVLYLLHTQPRTRKLSRYGTYDWRLEDVDFRDGPYIPINETTTKLTPSATGNAIPNMTSNTLPSGTCSGSGNRPAIAGTKSVPVNFLERDISYALVASQFWHAFDASDTTYWASNAQQKGTITYTPLAPFVCDGYVIYAATDNQDTTYAAKDYAPSTWTFEGYNGATWEVLDQQESYVLYDNNKSAFFPVNNSVAYQAYQLVVTKCLRNGLIETRVRRLTLRNKTASSFNLTASAVTGINNDTGFQPTDVGRLIRIKGSDASWRECKITARVSSTVVTVQLRSEPLLDVNAITQWRLGTWSDTTGWPGTGDFHEDRLWLAGSQEYPDAFAGSVVGAYETFSQTTPLGEVLDDSAVVGRLNARRLSRIRWLSSDSKGLLLGTGSEEYTLSSAQGEAISARTAKARPATRRGSADVEPVRIDNQVLYVQRSGRAIREFAFVFETDGYKSPSMSQLASHIGAVRFSEMDYAAEPHSIVWVKRADGRLVGLTYNRDESVVAWHQHDLAGGIIESLTVVPQKDQLQDALWVAVRRIVNGQTRRYIERLTRFWDFDTDIADAHFVDSGLRYQGAATATVYGLQHLEAEDVYGLADNIPVGPLLVTNGAVALPFEATNVVLGLGFDAIAELQRLENGAADGTAQGKVKRLNGIVVAVWKSFNGEVGVYNEEAKGFVYDPIEYPGRLDAFEDVQLYTGLIGPIVPAPGYDKEGRIAFRRPKESPLPFNMVAIMPQLNTQDR